MTPSAGATRQRVGRDVGGIGVHGSDRVGIGVERREQRGRDAQLHVVGDTDDGEGHRLASGGDGDGVADREVGTAPDGLSGGGRAAARRQFRRLAELVLGPDDRGVRRLRVVDDGRERSLPEAAVLADAVDGEDCRLQVRRQHAALQGPLTVDGVDQDGCRLVAQGADEGGQQPVLQCLLEQHEEEQEADGHRQQPEADESAADLMQGEEHLT